jgi:hypothetical protein
VCSSNAGFSIRNDRQVVQTKSPVQILLHKKKLRTEKN